MRQRGHISRDGRHIRQRRDRPGRRAFPVRAPGDHEHVVGRGGDRAVVVQPGGDRGVVVSHAVDVHAQLLGARMQLAGERCDERGECGAVGRNVVLQIEVHTRVRRARCDLNQTGERARAGARFGQDRVHGRPVLAVEARHHRDTSRPRVRGDRGGLRAAFVTTFAGDRARARFAFEVRRIHQPHVVRMGFQVGERVGRTCQHERLQRRRALGGHAALGGRPRRSRPSRGGESKRDRARHKQPPRPAVLPVLSVLPVLPVLN